MKSNLKVRCSVAILVLMGWSGLQSWGQTEYIQNGGFESGDTGWIMQGAPFGVEADNTPGRARSGSFYAWLGGALNEADNCYQLMTIPSDATSATLSFYYNIVSSDAGSVAHDFFLLRIRDPDENVLATLLQKDNRNRDPGTGPANYHNATFDLLPYAGQPIKVQFESGQNNSLVTSIFLDDVSLQVVEASAPAPTIQSVDRSGNTVNFSWASAVSRSYQVQYKTNLAQVSWINLGSPTTAVSTVTSSLDTIGPDPRRFYRIALLP